jgi:hypothetical protein
LASFSAIHMVTIGSAVVGSITTPSILRAVAPHMTSLSSRHPGSRHADLAC